MFASAEGKRGGEFYTPRCIVNCLGRDVATVSRSGLRPMLRFVEVCSCSLIRLHRGAHADWQWERRQGAGRRISIYGQESNYTTWRLAKMNLGDKGDRRPDPSKGIRFHNDLHPGFEGGLHPSQSAFQRCRIGAATMLAEDQALALWDAAAGQCELCLVAAHGLSPVAAGSCGDCAWRMARCRRTSRMRVTIREEFD